jgi:hypothetical protein
MEKILKGVFSLFIIIAILGGGIVFIMFVTALIIGGETGTIIATNAKDIVMPYFIRSATIGILAGLIFSYITKNHSLSL